jgi:predicted MFS family arabinose efflux permease
MMFMGAIPIGAMTAGYIADHVGVQVFLFGAGILLLVALVLMYVIPTRGMRSLDDPHDEGEPQ